MPRLLGDGGRLNEEVVGSVLEALARPGDVDHSIYNNVGNMHSLRPKFAGHGFGRIRCAALVGANPAKDGLPLRAEVLPVTMTLPLPALTIAGARRRAR